MKLRVLLALLVLVLGLAACSGGGATTEDTAADMGATSATEAAGEPDRFAAESAGGGGSAAGVGAVTTQARELTAADADGAAVEDSVQAPDEESAQQPVEPLPDAPPVRTGDRIIKEGTITIEVEQRTFDQSFTRVIAAARRYGGDVVGSSTSTDDDGSTFGSLTVRVPVSNFEDLLVGMGEIGTVRDRDIDSQDVTAEFTDLESRLRHLRAQESFYLELLDRAESVRDAIAVQQQLNGLQSQIEQIQGRLNLLDDRTSFSTLTVELFEPGTADALVTDAEPTQRPSLAHYWNTARDAFVNVIGALLVGGLFVLPLLLIVGASAVGWRLLRRPGPAPQRPQPPIERDRERETVGS